MSSGKSKGPIVDPALCRCCRSIKKCRLLTTEYEHFGEKEVYSDMFMDCFGLLLSDLDGDKLDACICATCVVRLRDASAFRAQVLQCEQAFLDAKLEKSQKLEVDVKIERHASDEDSPFDDRDDDEDYEPPVLPDQVKDIKEEAEDIKDVVGPNTRSKQNRIGKTELIHRVKRLQNKLDKMLDKPLPKSRREKSEKTEVPEPKPKKKKTSQKLMKVEPDNQDMIYSNAVLMVINSYVCPFLNRISNYYCYYCREQFTNPVELREHTLSHDPKKDFESMMEYKKIPKIDITRIDCRLCQEKIEDLATLRQHLSQKHGLQIFPVTNEFLSFKLSLDKVECTECGETFPYFDSLKKHMIDHFGTFICDQCGACFLEQNSLRTHINSHNRVESFFPCEICGKNLKSKYSRYLHIATVHEKKPTVNCYKCEACFLSYAQRNRHLIEVHGDKRTFACKQCDKVYNRRKTLMEHVRRNHLKLYRHQCELCDQRFYLPSRLKEHMVTHTGERNFRCEFCDKSYPRLQSLQEHVRSHAERRAKPAPFDMETAY